LVQANEVLFAQVVLPGCIDGVITGCILPVGKILGESAAIFCTAGLAL
jgi:phosphate transport system permease protein